MQYQFVAALCGAALTATSLAGCSDHRETPVTRDTVSYDGGAITRTNDAKVIVDGQQHKVEGMLACTTFDEPDDRRTIVAIGHEPKTVQITLSNGDSPTVIRVVLRNLLGYNIFAEPPRHGDASAAKAGKNYTITGTAWGRDTDGKEVTKPFEIQLTCP